MINDFLYKLRNTIAGGAIIISVFSILSRLIGLLRDRILASSFGAGEFLDLYYASFRLPDFLYNLLILGTLSVAFIPVFTSYLEKNKEEAWKICNSIINIAILFLGIISIFLAIFSLPFVKLVAPGFSQEKILILAHLTRLMLLSPIIFTLSNLATSILHSFKRFFIASLAPIFYNLGIIFGALFLVSPFGIFGLVYGIILGALLHFLIQLPSVFKTGFRYQLIFNFKHQGVTKIFKLFVPRVFTLSGEQISLIIATIIGSTLEKGSIAVFNLANNLNSFSIGIFSLPLAMAAFPYFTEAIAKKDFKTFSIQFSITLRRILYLIIPISIYIFLLRAQIVRLILGTGKFTWRDTILTYQMLGFFSFSLFAQSLIPLLARSFYSFHDTIRPFFITLFSMSINVIFALILTPLFGAPGLALAFSLSSLINLTLLFVFLKFKMTKFDGNKILISLFKIIFASLISALICQFLKNILGNIVNIQTFVGVLIQFSVSFILAVSSYFLLTLFLGCEEIEVIKHVSGQNRTAISASGGPRFIH